MRVLRRAISAARAATLAIIALDRASAETLRQVIEGPYPIPVLARRARRATS